MPHEVVAWWDPPTLGADPLGFPGYRDQLDAQAGAESVVTGRTAHYAFVAGDFDVFGGSMGAVHGDRVVAAYDRARAETLPLVVLAASGGARMQEGMVALVQMARTAAAAQRHADAGLLQVAILRSPTTGGVFASYAALAAIKAARAGATIGFAGPRVAEEMLGAPLPAGSHTAASAYAAGLVDAVLEAHEEAGFIERVLGLRDEAVPPRRPVPTGAITAPAGDAPAGDERAGHEPDEPVDPAGPLSAWAVVRAARQASRPTGIDWAHALCASWTELAGTDPTVRAGLVTFEGRRAVMVATDRFAADGRPGPAGFRLARRAARLAGRLGLALITLVDTPGADPGAASEAGGIAAEIAQTFALLAGLPVPVVSCCVGEGGSGGALALAFADRLLVQERAFFSVIAPEAAAVILHRDAARAPELAGALALRGADLVRLGVADAVVGEGLVELRAALVDALGTARPGTRLERFDAATRAALA